MSIYSDVHGHSDQELLWQLVRRFSRAVERGWCRCGASCIEKDNALAWKCRRCNVQTKKAWRDVSAFFLAFQAFFNNPEVNTFSSFSYKSLMDEFAWINLCDFLHLSFSFKQNFYYFHGIPSCHLIYEYLKKTC